MLFGRPMAPNRLSCRRWRERGLSTPSSRRLACPRPTAALATRMQRSMPRTRTFARRTSAKEQKRLRRCWGGSDGSSRKAQTAVASIGHRTDLAERLDAGDDVGVQVREGPQEVPALYAEPLHPGVVLVHAT